MTAPPSLHSSDDLKDLREVNLHLRNAVADLSDEVAHLRKENEFYKSRISAARIQLFIIARAWKDPELLRRVSNILKFLLPDSKEFRDRI